MSDTQNRETKGETLTDLEPTADPKAGQDFHFNPSLTTSAPPPDNILIGMLLPAVQKVRE